MNAQKITIGVDDLVNRLKMSEDRYFSMTLKYVEMQCEVERLQNGIRELYKEHGCYPTAQACEALFALVGLENNIGEKND